MNRPLIIGHRGAPYYAPENTITSYQKAIELGADGIEIDIHKTSDDRLVVCHDETVNRTTNGKGYIKNLSLKQIKSLDAGSWFDRKYYYEKIPALEEVLDLVKNKNILLNIELKNGPIFYRNIEEDVLEMIHTYRLENNTIISSFNHYSLMKIKMLAPYIKTGALYIAGMVSPWKYAKIIKADAIHPLYATINKIIVKECNKNGILVNTFTVDDENDIILVKEMEVNSIITNCPNIARKIVNLK